MRQHLNERFQIASQQRLAAGQANFLDAEVCEELRKPGDLLERQQVLTAEEFEIAAENLPWHAVRAAKVAAVGDRDPQIAKRAAETVEGHLRIGNTKPRSASS